MRDDPSTKVESKYIIWDRITGYLIYEIILLTDCVTQWLGHCCDASATHANPANQLFYPET